MTLGRKGLADDPLRQIAYDPLPLQDGSVPVVFEAAPIALLRFTDGNPLTITVLVGQALRNGLKTKAQIGAFVADLRAGAAKFDDEASEGRTRSLSASLGYGFEHAFSQDERGVLALLHFFQGFVNIDMLRTMGNPAADWCVPTIHGLTHEAGVALLDRAVEIGLLTSHGDGYYTIHPALPWFFKNLFDEHYPEGGAPDTANSVLRPSPLLATRAFVETMGALGNHYAEQFQGGNRDVIAALSAEEANLLHARHLARTHGWWDRVTSGMQGLRTLFEHTGRWVEWVRLVNEMVPDFVDLSTDAPLPGREEQWTLVTEYRVNLLREARQWTEAERLQRVRVDRARLTAEGVVGSPGERTTLVDWLKTADPNLDDAQRHAIRTLAVSLEGLGQIALELQSANCVAAFEESLALSEQIGDQAGAATSAVAIGDAYMNIRAIRALAKAEHWFRRSLDMHPEHARQGRTISLTRLGGVAMSRFMEARDADKPEAELMRHLNMALQSYSQALQEFPQYAVREQALTHNALGAIYRHIGDIDQALTHYRQAIHYLEGAYETFGDGAMQEVERTQQLITQIEQRAAER